MSESATPASVAKKLFAADLTLGLEVDDIFILAAAQQGQARNGPYWRLEFLDATGSIGGKIWSPQSQAYPDLAPGQAVRVKGRVSSYRDKLELAVENLRLLSESERAGLDMARFMPSSARSPDEMLEELRDMARKTLVHKPWRRFVKLLLADAEIAAALRLAPAAKAMHHNYAGGLLEHTLSVCSLCLLLADHYPQLDRQTLFAGALCHDLGKIWELSPGPAIDYTSSGRLIGHINLLMDKLAPFIGKAGLEAPLAEHLEHLILSHHGSYEFGSPRLPASAEAFALHYADNIDAKLQQVSKALEGVEQGGWSAYAPALERFLYLAPRSPGAVADKARAKAAGNESQEPLPLFGQAAGIAPGGTSGPGQAAGSGGGRA